MIIGKIKADREAVVELEIVGSNHSETVEVVISGITEVEVVHGILSFGCTCG